MRCVTSVSKQTDTRLAVKEAVAEARRRLEGGPPLVGALVFAGADHDPDAVAGTLGETLPGVPFIGCTTDGEVTEQGLSIDSLSLMLIASAGVRVRTACVPELGQDSHRAGVRLAQALRSETSRALIMLPDGLTGNGSAVIRGAQEVLGGPFVIAGGTAGDRGRFVKTHQFCNGRAHTDALVGLMFESDRPLDLGFGVMAGWRPMGIAKEVTRADRNTVYTIEGETALQVYSRFLGDKASELPAIGVEYPFALVDAAGQVGAKGIHEGEEYILLRAPMKVDHTAGSVTFAAEIPQGARIKMTRAKSQDVIEAAREAARHAMEKMTGRPEAVFFFTCMARKIVLGRRTRAELEAAQEALGREVPLIGFYTYGEIANCGDQSPVCRFHNETATFLTLRET